MRSFAEQEGVGHSALLLVGQASADEESPLPTGVVRFLLEGAESGSIGFSYVLPLQSWRRSAMGRVDADSPRGERAAQPRAAQPVRGYAALIEPDARLSRDRRYYSVFKHPSLDLIAIDIGQHLAVDLDAGERGWPLFCTISA